MKISVVINTYNEESNIERCLESVKDFGDEIIVVDMHSSDKTVDIAKRFKAKIFEFDYTRYVEPARNFALAKATGDWLLLIDADEELPKPLLEDLKSISEENKVDYVEIPRKNIIFNKWIKHSRWWPDYLVRFFKKGQVSFSEKIHEPPKSEGRSLRLEAREENALVHYNIQSVSQYIERIDRYSDIQSEELHKTGYKFTWPDLILKPGNEFFSRYFAGEGYRDGLHGVALGLLQACSELMVYLKIWQAENFKEEEVSNFDQQSNKLVKDLFYWQTKTSKNIFKKMLFKIKAKL